MKFSKTLAAVALVTASAASFAAPTFSIFGGTSKTYAGVTGTHDSGVDQGVSAFGPDFVTMGTLLMSEAGQITFSFFSKEASYDNSFEAFYVGGKKITGNLQGSFTVNVGAGAVNFGYKSSGLGGYITNGDKGTGVDINNSNASLAMIYFNDNAKVDGDYDDLTISAVAAIPEPETYAMMLAGLGLMGAIARRRNKAKTA